MKDEILQRLAVVLNALNNIDVKGKANLANLSGSIAMVEEVSSMLNGVEFADDQSKAAE